MTERTPSVFIRFGSHAEKQYLTQTFRFLDGVIVASNLIEATPGATSSLLVKVAGSKPPSIPYLIDPMTYVYGQDLDLLKSERKIKGKTVLKCKRSYKKLSDEYGGLFSQAIKRDRALVPSDFDSKSSSAMCKSIAEYQLERVKNELSADPETSALAHKVPAPLAIFAPYFYIPNATKKEWTSLLLRLAKKTIDLAITSPVHAVVCADRKLLLDAEFTQKLISDLPKTGVNGVWLWFSKLNELTAKSDELIALRQLVESLSNSMNVYNMHGGYFSLALSRVGMSGISHGIGYGEQKDVKPVQGKSVPMVRYYMPDLRKRLGVPQIELAFRNLQIKTPSDFHANICDCVVCRGVVESDLKQFTTFGDKHYSQPTSQRKSQTPAAAKRCRFHFILNRIRERDDMKSLEITDLISILEQSNSKWSTQPSIANEAQHLPEWITALKG